ncbi:hypothetical protein L873DRAFT_1823320 [Choiromyces venosus 120613-1]|uniref:Uncharacterized protein n=1 Tax=Choiromyces venosus 120613-1 TaxID=1336337 RepID=A0A3N4ITS6_9PEZI|nr:hypothetical protein L873DRAFT_1823320 [Choiromyces venosus 120613-1]
MANQSQKSITEDWRKTSRNHKEKKREKKYANLTTCPYNSYPCPLPNNGSTSPL